MECLMNPACPALNEIAVRLLTLCRELTSSSDDEAGFWLVCFEDIDQQVRRGAALLQQIQEHGEPDATSILSRYRDALVQLKGALPVIYSRLFHKRIELQREFAALRVTRSWTQAYKQTT